MPAITSGHPSVSALAAFALGKLDAPASETVHNHLAGCPDCRTVVETTPSDTLVGLLRNAAGDTASPVASALSGTRPVANPSFDEIALPPELRDHPRYRILRKLGEGGMGAVYQAEHKIMERVVAVKVISSGFVDSPEAAERFQREVRAAAKLEHPNIVRAYDADRAGSTMLLAMEFVKGRSLAEVVKSKRPLPVAHACHYVRQAANGLQHAADQGMVHRDIKPQNLMLTDKGVVKILDFGLAKLVSEQSTRAGLTGAGMVMGTPEYMAPEQARDTASADIRADIYALGCTLFCLLTGRPPFGGGTALEIVTKQVMDAPPRVTDLRPDVPAHLADLVARLLSKDPADRPQTPKEVATALAPLTKPAARTASNLRPGVSLPALQPPASRRSRGLVLAAVAAAALLAGTLFAGIVMTLRTKDGIVSLAVDPPDAKVEVADGCITIRPRGDNEPYKITVAEGGGKLRISRAGFAVETRDVTLSQKGTTIAVKLEPVTSVPRPADGFVSLFNGKDLTGWGYLPANKGTWRVENGDLVGRGGGKEGTNAWLTTTRKDFANVHLRMEVIKGPGQLTLRGNDWGNSSGSQGYIVRVSSGTVSRGIPGVAQKNLTWVGLEREINAPDGASYSLEAIVQGNTVRTLVNGEKVAEYTDSGLAIPAGGIYLGIRNDAEVRFRKIAIKELPPPTNAARPDDKN